LLQDFQWLFPVERKKANSTSPEALSISPAAKQSGSQTHWTAAKNFLIYAIDIVSGEVNYQQAVL
jgi:hypothetical protein